MHMKQLIKERRILFKDTCFNTYLYIKRILVTFSFIEGMEVLGKNARLLFFLKENKKPAL